MPRAITTTIIFQDADYFTAHVSDGAVRIGPTGDGIHFDIPAGHAYYDRTVEACDRVMVKALYDEMEAAFL